MTAWWDLTTFNYTRSNNLMDNFNALLDGSKTFTNLQCMTLTVSGGATIATLTVSGNTVMSGTLLVNGATLQVGDGTDTASINLKGNANGDGFGLYGGTALRGYWAYITASDSTLFDLYKGASITAEFRGSGDHFLSQGNFGIGTSTPGSKTEWGLTTANLELVNAGTLGATDTTDVRGWIEVQIGNSTGYIKMYTTK